MAHEQGQVSRVKQRKEKEKERKIPIVYRVTSARLAPASKEHYEREINRFLAHFKTTDIEPLKEYSLKQCKQMIIDYVIHLRENERLSRKSIKLHLSAIRYFFTMIRDDEFPISWTKVNDELPPVEYTHRDRGYTVDEIQRMIESGCQGRLREKAVILLLTSAGGMRIGAIPKLKKGDLKEMQTVQATSPQGAVVTYTVTATDAEDGQVTPTCSPASGSIFPVGSTQVTCTATDSAGNAATATFTVTVTPQAIPTPPPASDCVGTGSMNTRITGIPDPDTLIGTNGLNSISGLEGNDRINGWLGSDRIHGNADNDGIAGGPDNDDLNGDAGNDLIQGDSGNDRLSGGDGINTLTGGPGRDSFFCSPNSETTVTDFEPGIDRISGPCILAPNTLV